MESVTLYAVLKYLHIVLAIIAVGFNASYAIWIVRASRDPAHLGHTLRGVKFLDDRFANPAYLLLFVTGWTMVFVNRIPHTTFWITASTVLWLVAIVLGFAGYTPTLRNQIRALEAQGPASPEYQRLAARGQVLGIVLAVIVLTIVALMVFKPTLA